MSLEEKTRAYHIQHPQGKLSIHVTKPMVTPEELSLAYTPGVAIPCKDIESDPTKAYDYTSKGNLVGIISNGTAVLGLGNIGALASKPVMEGKAALFKKFAGVDAFDIEVDATDPDEIVRIVKAIAPTFGGINLEDIKAPECFYIEQELIKQLDIPVFHDDQHGTAVVACAAVKNALEIQGKKLADIKVVVSGAGAGAIACLNLLLTMGLDKKNTFVFDSKGLIAIDRHDLNPYKEAFAQSPVALSFEEAFQGADLFLGLSGPDVVSANMVKAMAAKPIILAMANPDPEISPPVAQAVRDDFIMATGRSDFPNQVNNVLCFPQLFRGALDVRATQINEAMKVACVDAIAALAKEPVPPEVLSIYHVPSLFFSKDYIIPKPFDPRLYTTLAIATAKAAMASGVARKPITDFDAYEKQLARWLVANP